MSKRTVEAITEESRQRILDYRNHLHENPELSFHEKNTSQFIREKLTEAGLPLWDGITGNSIVAELDSGLPGPTVLFRADMDALPIQEAVAWEHASRVPNVMHACGHDVHTATLLCLAESVARHRELLRRGKVRFCFQMAEELIPGGACQMVADGAAKGADLAFALHVGLTECGSIGVTRGPATAAIGTYLIRVKGKGGHSSMPQLAHDPVAALDDMATAIRRIVPYCLDPHSIATVSVGYIHTGDPHGLNTIPETGELGGSIRCCLTEDRERVYEEIEKIAQAVCQQASCSYELEKAMGYPATFNADKPVDLLCKAAQELGMPIFEKPASLGGEDFSYFSQTLPSVFYSLGVKNSERPETMFAMHNPRFHPEEESFLDGLKLELEILEQVQLG